jgi:hypothetical protein
MAPVEINVPCPKCRHSIPLQLDELQAGLSRACPGCGAVITFRGTDGSKVQQALDLLEGQPGVTTTVKVNVKEK